MRLDEEHTVFVIFMVLMALVMGTVITTIGDAYSDDSRSRFMIECVKTHAPDECRVNWSPR